MRLMNFVKNNKIYISITIVMIAAFLAVMLAYNLGRMFPG